MTTVRRIEKLLAAGAKPKLIEELLSSRPESCTQLTLKFVNNLSIAGWTVIRLTELSQSHVPLCGRMLRCIIAAQQPDGGWGDPLSTALCLRALLTNRGTGASVEAGIKYLTDLQKEDGLWPVEPFRRFTGDPLVSAFILLQLGDQRAFVDAVRFDEAMNWLDQNRASLDHDSRLLWMHATLRGRVARRPELAPALSWGG